jgi:sterol desaturase/sphingolipid hydroxylase (fatty acid hydroxylase superfamily)
MTLWFEQIGQIWWAGMVRDTARYAVFAIATWALLWVALKSPLQGRKIRQESPGALQMVVEFLISLRSIAVFASVAVGMTLAQHAGLYPLTHVAHQLGPLWFWASLVLMIVAHDAYYYWTHRAMHLPRFFHRFHRRHHRSHRPSPFTAYSFDLREAAVMVSFVAIWPLIVPTQFAVISLFVVHQIARNTLAHCGYELMPARADGRPLLDWLTTTTHHDLHHADARSNLGLYFTWWDRWMGTENPAYHAAFAKAAARKRAPVWREAEGLKLALAPVRVETRR